MRFPRAQFERFSRSAMIPDKDLGWHPCWPLYGGQQRMLDAIDAGLERGIHEFVCLACRQIGKTTLGDLLDMFWLQKYAGMSGILVSDDPKNMAFRRDVLLQMHRALPVKWRLGLRMNNINELAFTQNGSILMFDAVGKREDTSFGRSRPINYAHLDELGAWRDPRKVSALRAAFSDRHPHRLYWEPSTAQSFDVFYELWNEAGTSPTMRRVFVGAWAHEPYRIERSQDAIWEQYGTDPPTEDEQAMILTVADRYGYVITPEQLVWYRYILDAKCFGDEDMRAQEYPMVEEEAFVAFGDKFFRPGLIRLLRNHLDALETPHYYRYDWTQYLDEVQTPRVASGPLVVWEEPDPEGVYILSAHPAFSSSNQASDDVVQVWRAYPDRLVQVCEWVCEGGGPVYHVAWAMLHLGGAYRQQRRRFDTYMIADMQMTGRGLYREVERIDQRGYGFSPKYRQKGEEIRDFMGSFRHYFFQRPDSFTASAAVQWQSQPNYRPWLLNQFRDEVDRQHLLIRSAPLVNEMASLRRGEAGDSDLIAASATLHDCRVIAAAMAVEMWLHTVQLEIDQLIATKEESRGPGTVIEAQVGGFLSRLAATGRT